MTRAVRSAAPSVVLMVTSEMTAQAFYPGYPALLASRGWDVSLVASSEGGLQEFAAQEGITAYDIPMRRDPAPARDLVSVVRATALFRKLRPDAVVVSTPKAGLVGMLAARLTGVPIRIYQVWGLRHETEHGLRRAILMGIERVSSRLATQVVANSRSLAAEIVGSGIVARVDVLGHGSATGLDTDYFNPDRADIPPIDRAARDALRADAVTVGFVGRIHRDKGIDTLLGAVERCAARGMRLNLLLVGPLEDAALPARITSIESPSIRVVRVDAVKDTRPYFLAMDVHCLPTRREGFPTVVMEAAALAVPTITTDATGAKDSVVDGETGLIVPVDDVARLAAAIERLAGDPALRRQFGARARELVVRDFDRPTVLDLQEKNLRAQYDGVL